MKFLYFFCAFIFLTTLSQAQEPDTPITVGVYQNFKSTILKEDLTLQIYVPDEHSETKRGLPVLYLLDGQRFFFSGVGIQKTLWGPRAIPEMIVVGITVNRESRWKWYMEEREDFSSFLTDELIPYVNSQYSTNGDHVIFGWEAGAYFAAELILKHPEAFGGAILSNGGYASEEVIKGLDANHDTYLYVANSRQDIYNIGATEEFHELLKAHSTPNLIWTYELHNDEIHESLSNVALYKGLKYYYHNYNSLAFESIQQFNDLGGLNYLTAYFQGRSRRFGFDEAIDNSTKNTLIWLAWNRDNFEYFQLFMTEFADVLTTDRYASAYWQNRFGQFYLKHQDYENAIRYFNAGLSKYPGSRFDEPMKKGLQEAKSKK